MADNFTNDFLKNMQAGRSGEPSKKRKETLTGNEASIELPGRGEYFVVAEIPKDNIPHGLIYLLPPNAYSLWREREGSLPHGLASDQEIFQQSAKPIAISSLTEARTNPQRFGLQIYLHNNPRVGSSDKRLTGAMDIINQDKKTNPLFQTLTEGLRGLMNNRLGNLLENQQTIPLNFDLWDMSTNPQALVKKITQQFIPEGDPLPNITNEKSNNPNIQSFRVKLPLKLFE